MRERRGRIEEKREKKIMESGRKKTPNTVLREREGEKEGGIT